ncbi:MAG: SDR family oxidoreductase [Trueperaceae bacterium]|nr:SDR family oxidoreductase [Trueperaceae bacterium]
MSLSGQVIVITGASRGIGEACALELAAQGAAVVLTARNEAAVKELAKNIEAKGGKALGIAADVTDYQALESVLEQTLKGFGKVTGLINNAGIIEPIAFLDKADPSAWAQTIQINLIGAYNAIRVFLPQFMAQDQGLIINISSGAAFNPLEGWSAYCASKAGLAMLTRSVMLETQDKKIRAFGFGPGVVDTDMQGLIRASGINRVSQIPREHLGPASDVARAVAYLCTEDAADLVGELDIRHADLRQRVGLQAL